MKRSQIIASGVGCLLLVLGIASCCAIRPFKPVDLQVIGTNEEAFLIPLIGDTKKQVATSGEEFLKERLVFTKQVQIPQQWIPRGYEWIFPHGEWKPSGVLIKVDRSPITRVWTADSATGTSNLNQAIWVMTADQVEFSTGWTCTARINDQTDAVKFLFNYPNGSLEKVLDQEVRAQIQTRFGLEVTDLPMEELRKNATPHLKKVIDDVEKFFLTRGINITNLGISGGFVYKDVKIGDKIVEVFNAEQEKTIQIARSQAQEQANKQVIFQAEGKAKALLTEREAEAKGIRVVAEAKAYEVEKATGSPVYTRLKELDNQLQLIKAWDGKYPLYFMGGTNPNTLLSLPTPEVKK